MEKKTKSGDGNGKDRRSIARTIVVHVLPLLFSEQEKRR